MEGTFIKKVKYNEDGECIEDAEKKIIENGEKYVFMFSEEAASKYGYFTAKVVIEGEAQNIKYSAIYKEEEDANSYAYNDKKIVGKFNSSQLQDVIKYEGKMMRNRLGNFRRKEDFELPQSLQNINVNTQLINELLEMPKKIIEDQEKLTEKIKSRKIK